MWFQIFIDCNIDWNAFYCLLFFPFIIIFGWQGDNEVGNDLSVFDILYTTLIVHKKINRMVMAIEFDSLDIENQ